MEIKEAKELLESSLASIKEEQLALKEKKKEITKQYKKNLKEIEKLLLQTKQKLEDVEKLKQYKRKEVLPVIAYLVSLIEEKEYSYYEVTVPISSNYEFDRQKIWPKDKLLKICFIAENLSRAQKEIDQWIKKMDSSAWYLVQRLVTEFLLKPKRNYVQINFYTKTDGVYLTFLDSISKFQELFHEEWEQAYEDTFSYTQKHFFGNTSHITDNYYFYIHDFFDFLTVQKITLKRNELSVEEMMDYAKEFADSYKKEHQVTRSRKK